MAKSVAIGLSILYVLLIIAPLSHSLDHNKKEITLYAQVIRGTSSIPVAGPEPPRNNMFGVVFVMNIIFRESINLDSPPLGRSQGIQVVSSMDGIQRYVSGTFTFDSGEYKGSTLQFQGILRFGGSAITGELSIPSGTKSFRFVSGYDEVQTVQQIPSANTTIDMLKITLVEYD